MTSRADALLSGPRGRRLCLELLLAAGEASSPRLEGGGPASGSFGAIDVEQARRSLAIAVGELDVSAVATTTDPAAFLPALSASVVGAMYWQEPDEVDRLLAAPAVGAELVAVGEAVAQAPASQWWVEPLAAAGQHTVAWALGDPPVFDAPLLGGAGPALRRWREQTAAEERRARRERSADPRASWSGEWWSTPAHTGRLVTTRALPQGERADKSVPLRLTLVEDDMGWASARSWPVHLADDARVLELTGSAAWTALVEQYPCEVTASRRHDWWRVTGRDETWVVPDWAAVAADVDAVHLTVDGYLSTAGRALPVHVPSLGGPAATLLAGWDPDATWWLADHVAAAVGEPVGWRRQDSGGRWAAVSASRIPVP